MRTLINRCLVGTFLLVIAVGFSKDELQGKHSEAPSEPPEVIAALGCLTQSEMKLRLDPAFAGDEAYRIRFVIGVKDPSVDRANELHMIVYGKDRLSALLYEALAEHGKGHINLQFINTASLRLKNGRWMVEETLGGVYSYSRVQDLVDIISKTQALNVPRSHVSQSNGNCIYQ